MPRILYWNIEQFNLNKINNPGPGAVIARSFLRKARIINTIIAAQPHIFVIVEQAAGTRPPTVATNGTLVVGNGLEACQDLLLALRALGGGYANWCLVPPLISGTQGRAEAIAVFYRADVLEFVGPWVWPAVGPAVAPAGGVVRAAYGGGVANFLPAGNVSAGSPLNPGLPYRQLAGRWQFMDALGTVIQFPGVGNRSPFQTSFRLLADGRLLHLLSFHAPAKAWLASAATQNLAQIPLLHTAPAANEAVVLVGDFNVDLNGAAAAAAYGPLLAIANMNRMLQPVMGPGLPENWYLYTHLKPTRQATPMLPAGTVAPDGYPGFKYMGSSTMHQGYDSIDNIFWVVGAAWGAGAGANATVLNPVVGSPYTQVAPAPGGAPTGSIVLASQLANPIPLPNGYAGHAIGTIRQFQGWNNYRLIRSTSDHLALAMDI
jgi:hypothetical protein